MKKKSITKFLSCFHLLILVLIIPHLTYAEDQKPKYKILFADLEYKEDSNIGVQYFVENGILKARIRKTNWPYQGAYVKNLILYDPDAGFFKEKEKVIHVNLKNFDNLSDGSEIVVDEMRNIVIDPSVRAPDNYYYDPKIADSSTQKYRGFAKKNIYKLKKENTVYTLSLKKNYYDNQLEFLGWVIKN